MWFLSLCVFFDKGAYPPPLHFVRQKRAQRVPIEGSYRQISFILFPLRVRWPEKSTKFGKSRFGDSQHWCHCSVTVYADFVIFKFVCFFLTSWLGRVPTSAPLHFVRQKRAQRVPIEGSYRQISFLLLSLRVRWSEKSKKFFGGHDPLLQL